MNLEIISPEKSLYQGEVKLVQLPGSDGSFEILKDHAPLISALAKGQVKVVSIEGALNYFDINGGVIEVQKNKIIILAEA